MNEKITFPRLASLLADRSGRSKRFSEDFLREFFSLISERLEAGESVKVKGLGTFRLSRVEPRRSVDVTTGQPMEISGHSKVVFVPAKELAEAVNAPFEAFTAIEINDDVDISQLLSEDEIALKQETDDITEGATTLTSEVSNSPTLTKAMTSTSNEKEESSETLAESVDELHIHQDSDSEGNVGYETEEETSSNMTEEETDSNMTEEETDSTEAEDENSGTTDEEEGTSDNGETEDDEDFEEETERKRGWLKILMISLCAAMVALIATLAVWYIYATDSFNTVFEKPLSYVSALKTAKGNDAATAKDTPFVLPDTIKVTEAPGTDSLSSLEEEPEVPTAPSDAVVYDTIGNTRYLTTMAKSHYGNYNLWPYIYEENKSFLGHPDRIRPGTPVVIPKLSKYGVDPTNEEDIEKAKKLGIEIYARYGKKI